MSFQRVDPYGFFKNDTLTSDEANQLDTNISNAVDKRDGYSDTIYSALTMASGSGLTFVTGSHLVVNDPSSVSIADGYLSCGAAIIGATKPLRLGMAVVSVNSTNYVVSSSDYAKYVLVLTGTLTGSTNVILPTIAGYSKLIDNTCVPATDGYTLKVKTLFGGGVIIPSGKSAEVYCDGLSILTGPIKPANYVVDMNWKGETGSGYGVQYQHVTGTAYTNVSGYLFTYTDVKAGDIFEITYTSGLINTSGVGTTYLATATSQGSWLNETISQCYGTTEKVTTISTRYTSAIDDTNFTVGLVTKVDDPGHDGYVKTPLSFSVKRIRP